MKDRKGFLSTLFDFSFSEFVTLRIISILYGIWMVMAGIGALIVIVAGFQQSAVLGIVALLLSPVLFCLWLLMGRIMFESTIVLFRIAANTKKMADTAGGDDGAPAL